MSFLNTPKPCVDIETGKLCWEVHKGNQMWVEIEVTIAGTHDRIHSSWGDGAGGYSKICDKITRVPEEVYENLFIRFEDAPKSW